MTVKELIERLSLEDQGALVVTGHNDGGYNSVTRCQKVSIYKLKKPFSYEAEYDETEPDEEDALSAVAI